MFCITKEKKHLKENIKPHFIRRILIQMRLSLLSLFSIKNSRSFVPLNFINEAIIRGAASLSLSRQVCGVRPQRRATSHRPAPYRTALRRLRCPTAGCDALINRWSPALHELQRFLTFIRLSPLNFIRLKRPHLFMIQTLTTTQTTL